MTLNWQCNADFLFYSGDFSLSSDPIWSPHSKLQIEKVQKTAVCCTCNRWRNTRSVKEMLDKLKWPPLEARRDQSSLLLLRPGGTSPPYFSFTRYIVEQVLLKKTSTWPLLTVWKLPGHQIVLNTADTRHKEMPWRIPFFPPNYVSFCGQSSEGFRPLLI